MFLDLHRVVPGYLNSITSSHHSYLYDNTNLYSFGDLRALLPTLAAELFPEFLALVEGQDAPPEERARLTPGTRVQLTGVEGQDPLIL